MLRFRGAEGDDVVGWIAVCSGFLYAARILFLWCQFFKGVVVKDIPVWEDDWKMLSIVTYLRGAS